MADIFHEVDEEVRREQLQRLWARYGVLIMAFAVLLVAGVAGWRAYENWQTRKAAEVGSAFETALTLAEDGKRQEAEVAFGKVMQDGTPGYRALARLRAAAELAQADPKAAIAAYDKAAADTAIDGKLRDLASIRAAFLLLETGAFDDVRRKAEVLTDPRHAFRHSARELLALAAWKTNDAAGARRWAELIVNDAESPAGLRTRMQMLLAIVPASGTS